MDLETDNLVAEVAALVKLLSKQEYRSVDLSRSVLVLGVDSNQLSGISQIKAMRPLRVPLRHLPQTMT